MFEVAFHIHPSKSLENAWQELETAGCHLLYSTEDSDGTQVIFGFLPAAIDKKTLLDQHPYIREISETSFNTIDWTAQWAAHAGNYHNGYVHVDIQSYCKDPSTSFPHSNIRLEPGPGFGDLSHPTTRLILSLMGKYIKDKCVIDIGCGSGILSLAAYAMGAQSVIGIDIDEDALTHARVNSQLNEMNQHIEFLNPQMFLRRSQNTPEKDPVILMNMIESEQIIAWNSLPTIHPTVHTAITSGILKSGKKSYLKLTKLWGWNLIQEIEEEGWLGFVFNKGG